MVRFSGRVWVRLTHRLRVTSRVRVRVRVRVWVWVWVRVKVRTFILLPLSVTLI